MSTPDIVQVIQDEILSDDENDSARLIATYQSASPEKRAIIDDVLISICGWGMPHLIDAAKSRGYEVDD